MSKKTYKIPVYWTMFDTMRIEADSLKEAIDKAIDIMPLPEGDYVDGSFTVEMETLNEIYPEEIRDEKINNLLKYEPIPKS
jgi:hypothetical protein